MTKEQRAAAMARVKEHVYAILTLPNDKPREYESNWPEIVRKFNESFNLPGARSKLIADTRWKPNPSEIDAAMSFVEFSFSALDQNQRIALWGFALKAPAKRVSQRLHCSVATTWIHRNDALDKFICASSPSRCISPS